MYDIQRANMSKRISALLLDVILLFTLIVGFAWAIFGIAGYDNYSSEFERIEAKYIAEIKESDGIDLNITSEEYEKLSEEERKQYVSASEKLTSAINSDEIAMHNYGMMMSITMLAVSLSILLSYLILEFAIPLFLRNGQTIGKKVFGIGIMFTSGVRINPVGLFIRTVLGKYTVETMVPVLIIVLLLSPGSNIGFAGTAVILLILALELGLLIMNKNRPMIHDAFATTVCVDMASQMIFNSADEMVEYKKRVHAEEADRAKYLD